MAGLQLISTPAKTSMMPKQAIDNLGNAIANGISKGLNQNNSNVFVLKQPQGPVNRRPIPDTLDYTAASNNGTGAASKTLYIFNEDIYNESPTTNGSGANSITFSYGDGFSGNWYNASFNNYHEGQGMYIYGFNVAFTTTTTGVSNLSAFNQSNFQYNPYNGYGSPEPIPINFNQALRNTAYIQGLLTFRWEGFISRMGQFSIVIPPNNTLTMSFFTNPQAFANAAYS